MIVITSKNEKEFRVLPGDTFTLTCSRNDLDRERNVLIRETINKAHTINFIVSFVFTNETGTCLSPNLCGFFGNKNNLPEEMKDAKNFADLTEEQKSNFINSCCKEVAVLYETN